MRVHVPCTAVGLTLAAAIPAAHAQMVYDAGETVVAPQPVVVAPAAAAIVTPPAVRTVRTVTTTTAAHPVRNPLVRRRVAVTRHIPATRHPYVTGRVAPATTTTTTTVATTMPAPAPYVGRPVYDRPVYDRPVYDAVAAPPPATVQPYDTEAAYNDTVVHPAAPAIIPAATAPAAVPVGPVVPAYRYVYQDDRILVIDPNTGIAVEALPR